MNSRLFHKDKGLFDFNKTLIRLCKTFQTSISAKYLRKNSFLKACGVNLAEILKNLNDLH